MPQNFVQTDFEPLMAAGRSLAQLPGRITSGIKAYGQAKQLEDQNAKTYTETVAFFDQVPGMQYDRESLKPRPGESNYSERLKTSIVPLIGQMEQRGVKVKELLARMQSPAAAYEPMNALAQKQAGQERQQAITQAVGTAAGPTPGMGEEQLKATGGASLPPEQYAEALTEPTTMGRVFGKPAPKKESEFYGNLSEQFSTLPEGTTTEEIAGNPAFLTAQKGMQARTAEGQAAAAQEEKMRQMRLKMAMDIWEKVKAGNKVFKDGTLVDKPSFYDIFQTPEQYSVESGAAPRAPGNGGGWGSGDQPAVAEDKLWRLVISTLARENTSDFITKDQYGMDLLVPKVKPNTRSAQILAGGQPFQEYVYKRFPNMAQAALVQPSAAPQKGPGIAKRRMQSPGAPVVP